MIKASLIILPTLDVATLVSVAQTVTGKNHVRATDAKNLPNKVGEMISILEDFGGNAFDGQDLVNFGFLFVGTTNLIIQVPQLVSGCRFVTSSHSTSDLLRASIVLAPIRPWIDALSAARGRSEHLYQCFEGIVQTLQTYSPQATRLRLK
jgi:hypothetical protein